MAEPVVERRPRRSTHTERIPTFAAPAISADSESPTQTAPEDGNPASSSAERNNSGRGLQDLASSLVDAAPLAVVGRWSVASRGNG